MRPVHWLRTWGQCFNVFPSVLLTLLVGWQEGQSTHKTCATYPERFWSRTSGWRKPRGLANSVSPGKQLLEQVRHKVGNTDVACMLLDSVAMFFALMVSSHFCFPPPFPQIDIIGAMMIVWRVRGKIIRSVLCSIVCSSCAQCSAHMNRANTACWLDLAFLWL